MLQQVSRAISLDSFSDMLAVKENKMDTPLTPVPFELPPPDNKLTETEGPYPEHWTAHAMTS